MTTYIIKPGAVPELSLAEIRALVEHMPALQAVSVSHGYIVLEASAPIDIVPVFERLGGAIYVAEKVGTMGKDAVESIADVLEPLGDTGKIQFGCSGISDKVGISVKKELKQRGHSVRYVAIQNMATVVHNNLVERGGHLSIVGGTIYRTLAVHDFEAMAAFDEDRPAYDSKSGMLPPKLARMMLNIARVQPETKLLDAFCGSGTVLLEAMQLGVQQCYGTDISEKAVADTKTNIAWMKKNMVGRFDSTVAVADVRSLSDSFPAQAIDVIVSEPYMGKPKTGRESLTELENEVKELESLYAEMLGSFAYVLVPGGTVVFSKPRFMHQGSWKTISWEAALQKYGFTIDPLLPHKDMVLYARDGQHVGREIWKLRLEG